LEIHDLLDHHRILLLEPQYVTPKRVNRDIGFLQGALGASAHLVHPLQVGLQVLDLMLQGLTPLLVSHQGGIGLGTEVRVACLEVLSVLPLELLLQADPPLVQHAVHSLLEGRLAQLQRFAVLGQVGVGLVDHLLPALKGLPLPGEPVLEGGELLLPEAQLPFAVANFRFPHSDTSLLQAQALRAGIGALLASVKQGLVVLSFLQPLPCIG
jgi:hypothetical protein